MTVDQLVASLARCRKRNAELRSHNHKLWLANQEWKRKHSARRQELNVLRARVKRLDLSRLRWKSQVPSDIRKQQAPPNVFLSHNDLNRILEIPTRD